MEIARVPDLAVDGGAVGFGFPRGADYPHEAVSELLQDHPLRLHLRLVSLLRLLGLLHQALARRLQHLLRHERVRQPAGGAERGRSDRKHTTLHVLGCLGSTGIILPNTRGRANTK